MNRRSLILAPIAAMALSGLAPAHAQTALSDVMSRKTIVIAIPTDFPPFGFVGTDLKPQGLDIEIGRAHV